MSQYTFSSQDVLGLLSNMLYPSPDDGAHGVVWWHGRPYPWPGPAGLAKGIPTPQPAIDARLKQDIDTAMTAAFVYASFPKSSFALKVATAFLDECGNVPMSVLLREVFRHLHGPVPPDDRPHPNWLTDAVEGLAFHTLAERMPAGAIREEALRTSEQQVNRGLAARNQLAR